MIAIYEPAFAKRLIEDGGAFLVYAS
jgi:hypothetical protein